MLSKNLQINVHGTILEGDLMLPDNSKGLIIFSNGNGSGRFSRTNQMVAEKFRNENFGTLLIDLLTIKEDRAEINRLNIELLTHRLIEATKWVKNIVDIKPLPIGYYCTDTGTACVMGAASVLGTDIRAIVSRGGRLDLAMDVLKWVKSPTLLIAGGNDSSDIKIIQLALQKMKCEKEFQIIAGASHEFDEPGKLERVAKIAAEWYQIHLSAIQHEILKF